MKKLPESLSEEEREIFAEAFYTIADMDDDRDGYNPNPWGCPWEWSRESLEGESLEDMAKNHWEKNKEEILKLIEDI